jgi:ribonuclease E
MKKKILINAIYPEEKRVAIVQGEALVDFYVEAAGREHLKGNIYKGVVARVEPGLQAAFVDFGMKKHGFLQMREIMPEYFKPKDESKRKRIQDVLSKGQELIVQVEKDERDTKGASLTTYISIPGRYIVMMPGQERIGISRKIEDREDRNRMKDMFNALKLPKKTGFILRTAGGDTTSEELDNDLKYLTKLWAKIQRDAKKVSAPALIYQEQDIAVRTVRDYLTSDVIEVLIDDQEAYKKTKEYLLKTAPWRKINIRFYKEKKPIFSRHSIEEQIAKIQERYVYLPSRGYLVIDKTEALTAIDVNSGRSRKEENVEATAFKTNMEAADEVARQFRLRDIGGLIVIDFIDMASSRNRRDVENRLRDALSHDKAHTETSGISKFGMVEMTRERLRTAYFESVSKRCEVCGGTGTLKSDEMVAVMAFRSIHAKAARGGIRSITCHLPVASLNHLLNTKRDEIWEMEKDFGVKISILADPKLTGQFTVEADGEKKPEEPREKAEKHEKHERHEPQEKHEKAHVPATEGKPEQTERHVRPERSPKHERGGKREKAEKAERPVQEERHEEHEVHERVDKHESPEGPGGHGGEIVSEIIETLEKAEGLKQETSRQPERKEHRGRRWRRGRRTRGPKNEGVGKQEGAGATVEGERTEVQVRAEEGTEAGGE